ncbi:MAG: sulfatase [Planctomycetes bacterium]|nr:sulfatase [Planctomycetota bacterium]
MRPAFQPFLASLALAFCGCGTPDPPRAAGDALSVILVSLDTCRADRLSPFGAPGRNSPFLDRLARESVIFTDCLSQSSNTAPSHRSLFTGQYVHRHGHDLDSFRRSPTSWAGMLGEAGWDTAAFTGGGFLARGYGFEDGFATFVDADDDREAVSDRGLATILPQVRRWREQRHGDPRPFFLFLHTFDIHCPYEPDDPWRSEFTAGYGGDLQLDGACGQEDFRRILDRSRSEPPGSYRADIEHLGNTYDAGVAMTDAQLGGFLAELRADGTLDRSLLIVLSDHGESLGDRRPYIGHNRLWEEQLQVPLMIRFPDGAFAGAVCDEPTMLIDVLPAVLDRLGIDPPEGIQGESLLPLLDGSRSYQGRRLRVSQFLSLFSFRYDDRWKVHGQVREDGKGDILLYDLERDPLEQRGPPTDPAEAQAQQARMQRLVKEYSAWRRSSAAADGRSQGPLILGGPGPSSAEDLRELGYAGY